MLKYIVSGVEGDLPPVLLVHGLFGLGRNLGGVARRLSQERLTISVDMRNHGDSFHSPDHSYMAMANDLAEVIQANGGCADLVGHSMGGKAAMTLALTQPSLLRRLAVLDIAPLPYAHRQTGYIDAMEAMDLCGLSLRSAADRRLSAHIPDPGIRAFLLQSLDLKSTPPRWKMNLAELRANMDLISGFPENLIPGAFQGPTVFLAGGESDYCDRAGIAEIDRRFPQAKVESIDGVGHWLHAEAPEKVGNRLAAFLN